MKSLVLLIAVTMLSQSAPARDPAARRAVGTAVIRGVVVDEVTGAPIAGARVSAEQRTGDSQNPPAPPEAGAGATTGADGRFELTGLAAGAVVVSANAGELRASHLHKIVGHDDGTYYMGTPSMELSQGQIVEDLRIALKRATAVEGFVVDEFGDPMAGVSVTARAAAGGWGGGESVSDDRGWFRMFGMRPGTYEVCAAAERSWSLDMGLRVDDGATRYGRTCTPDVRATSTDVAVVQLQMRQVTTHVLSGRVISSSGIRVSTARVSIISLDADGGGRTVNTRVTDGEFIARGLFPGEYSLFAYLPDPGGNDTFSALEGSVSSLRLDGSDVTDLTVTLAPAGVIRGRVVRDPRAKGALPTALAVSVRPPLPLLRSPSGRPPSAPVDDTAAFEVRGIIGEQAIFVSGLPRAWCVASARQGDDDIRGRARDFAQDRRPVVIVVTDRCAAARVRPVDSSGGSRTDTMVVAVPADPARWKVAPPMEMPVRDPEGRQLLTGLAPGDYYLAAIPVSEMEAWVRLPSFEPLVRTGRRVTLTEGEPQVLDVPVSNLGEAR